MNTKKKLKKAIEKKIDAILNDVFGTAFNWERGNREKELIDIATSPFVFIEGTGYEVNDNPIYFMKLSSEKNIQGFSAQDIVDILNEQD